MMSAATCVDSALTGRVVTPLVGRESELGLIERFFEGAVTDGGALLLTGEPGVGKTALLEAATAGPTCSTARILRAAGVEFEAEAAFSGLRHLLPPLRDAFDSLAVAQREVLQSALGRADGAPHARIVLCNTVLTLLRSAAEAGPVVIVVDDLHWLDRASSQVLAFVGRRLAGTKVAFLAAVRSDAEVFFDRAGLAELDIPPLSDADASGLLEVHYPHLSPLARPRLLAQARGNPLAVIELPRALGMGLNPGPARGGLPRGRRLQAVYGTRLTTLPEPCRRLLLMAALAGTADLRVLDDGDGVPAALDHLAAAERARLVEINVGAARVRFRHPLIRAAVVECSTDVQRRGAHRRLAGTTRHDPERRAWHLGQAAVEPDDAVAGPLEQAARRMLRRGDAVGAVEALERSAELSVNPAERARRLSSAASVGANVTGDLRDAEALLRRAREFGPDPTASVESAIAAAFVLLHADGDVDTAHRLVTQAVGAGAQDVSSPDLRIEVLRMLLLICRMGGQADLWESLRRLRGPLMAGVPESAVLSTLLSLDPVRSPRAARAHLDRELGTLALLDDPTEILRIASSAALVDRLPDCRQALARVARGELAGGAVASMIWATNLLANDAFHTGQWQTVAQFAQDADALCVAHGYGLLRLHARASPAFVAAGRGDVVTAQALSDEMRRWAGPRRVGYVSADAEYTSALTALSLCDFDAAYRHAERITPAGTIPSCELRATWVMLDLVEAGLRTGRLAAARAHAAAIEASGVARRSSRTALLAGAAAALVAPDAEAIERFGSALATPGSERWAFDRARVELLFGERLRRVHETAQARLRLTAALQTFERLGAMPWAERAVQELRATGLVSVRLRAPDRDALTPQELEIAQLAAAGLTNKQIGQQLYLSHRTVGAHLYRIFPKLRIASRAALRDALGAMP